MERALRANTLGMAFPLYAYGVSGPSQPQESATGQRSGSLGPRGRVPDQLSLDTRGNKSNDEASKRLLLLL